MGVSNHFMSPLVLLHLSSCQPNTNSASSSALYKYNPNFWLSTAWTGYSLLDLPGLTLSLLWSVLILRALWKWDLVSSSLVWSGQGRKNSLFLGAWTSSHGTYVVWVCLPWQAAKFLKVTVEAGCAVKTSQKKPQHWQFSCHPGNHVNPSQMTSSPNTRDVGWIRVWGGRRHWDRVRRDQRLTKGPTWQADKGWVCGWRASLRHSTGWGRTALSNRISLVLITKKVKRKKIQSQMS